MKKVTLIKLGGAVITDKSIPNTPRPDVIKRLIKEIKNAQQQTGQLYVIGHGSGSFAHAPAMKYGTIDGFRDEESRLGMAIVQDSAATLNRLVVRAFIEQDLPAVSLCCSSAVVTKNKQADVFFDASLREYLKQGLMPITYGDVLVDSVIGTTIWSTDKILNFFTWQFLANGWQVDKVIHATQVPGVLRDLERPELGIFDEISSKNIDEVRKVIGGTKGFDVTGGMGQKLTESLEIAALGVPTIILSGDQPDALYNALQGERFSSGKNRRDLFTRVYN